MSMLILVLTTIKTKLKNQNEILIYSISLVFPMFQIKLIKRKNLTHNHG